MSSPGVFDGGAAGIAARSGSGAAGVAGAIAAAGAGSALTVEVQDRAKMTIEIVTLKCAGDCADAAADSCKSGIEPGTSNVSSMLMWLDGSTYDATSHTLVGDWASDAHWIRP